MRHGNKGGEKMEKTYMFIPILPMRHGNNFLRAFLTNFLQFRIPILPMRHGNIVLKVQKLVFPLSFRSYLWGMETVRVSQKTISLLLPFRSYLWGMETRDIAVIVLDVDPHSDPTYEAWKQKPELILTPSLPPFRSYLRGMETREISGWFLVIYLTFRSYLRGMKTSNRNPHNLLR